MFISLRSKRLFLCPKNSYQDSEPVREAVGRCYSVVNFPDRASSCLHAPSRVVVKLPQQVSSQFSMARESEQKYYLRHDAVLWNEFKQHYPRTAGVTDSAAV